MIRGNALIIESVQKTEKRVDREEREGSDEYEEFIVTHQPNGDINDQRSAGSMDTTRPVECLQALEKDRKLKYINYLGDGNSKLFSEISKMDIYSQKTVKKLEYQKASKAIKY